MLSTIVKSTNVAGKNKTTSKKATAKKSARVAVIADTINKEGELKKVATADIDVSPLNYRKFYSLAALNDFAAEIALHGIISPLTLRKMPSGRYELVAGERRYRASLIAGLIEVPAVIKALTDEEVTEIQLAENLQRENPHPMHEAQAIGQMKKAGKSIDEIAARLGKSAKFVYSRLKFLDLIEVIQEMFVADALTMQEAFDIAALSAESQQEFFTQHCAEWKEEEDFKITNLRYALSRFKYDLNNAPFNTKDKKLLPEMGACTHCPFNSATLKTLFPEIAAQATCTKRECYQTKCDNNFIQMFKKAFEAQQPDAIIYSWALSETLQKLLDSIAGTEALPRFSKNEITLIQAPEKPTKGDFMDEAEQYGEYGEEEYDEEEMYSEDSGERTFDEAGYNAAFFEYDADLEEYNNLIAAGGLLKGLLVSETEVQPVMFSPDAPKADQSNKKTATAKEVQDAIKAGTATPELLQGELDRINGREERAKQLDKEKIQVAIHAAFIEGISDIAQVSCLTAADLVAARLLIYQSLDWTAKNKFSTVLFPKDEKEQEFSLYERLQNLTEQQFSFLISTAIGCKSDGKYPNNPTGETIREVAEAAGVDIALIHKEQQSKADKRKEKLDERTNELNYKLKKLNKIIK